MDSKRVQAGIVLASAPDLRFDLELGWFRGREAVRERAAQVIAATPQPPGRSSASELRWGEGEQMSSLSEGDIQLMVQGNAICDWIRYMAERLQVGADIDIGQWALLDALTEWPAIRHTARSRALSGALVAARVGDDLPLRRLAERCERPPMRRRDQLPTE